MKKVILITGASSGIGLATARQLISEDYVVYASARKNDAYHEIKDKGGFPLRVAMEDEVTMKAAVDEVIKDQGRIDVLFNHAGWGHYGPIEEMPLETARTLFEINLFGLARLTQLVIPHMRKQKSGTIMNTSSIGGKVYFPLGAWYHASKHAIEGWSDCLRLEMKPHGIRVIIIEPGIIDTGFNEAMIGRIADLKSTGAYDRIKNIMLSRNERTGDRGSSPEVIANLVSKALRAKRPKTRYHAGKISTSILLARQYLPDKLFDRLILSRFK